MKGQSSFEYLLVFSLIFLIVVPVIWFLYSATQEQNQELTSTQIEVMGKKIINEATDVYYLGRPAKTTFEVDVPKGIKNINITSENILIFEMENGEIIPYSGRVKMIVGNHKSNDENSFDETAINKGRKIVIIESDKNNNDENLVKIFIGK